MVERHLHLNTIFNSLSDPTRRDILLRVSQEDLSIGQLALSYKMTFAAVAKHITVLEAAKLVKKKQSGKHQIVQILPKTMQLAQDHLDTYKEMWESRFAALDELLSSNK